MRPQGREKIEKTCQKCGGIQIIAFVGLGEYSG